MKKITPMTEKEASDFLASKEHSDSLYKEERMKMSLLEIQEELNHRLEKKEVSFDVWFKYTKQLLLIV